MNDTSMRVVDTPIGMIRLTARDGRLVSIDLGAQGPVGGDQDPALDLVSGELALYFAGKLTTFTVPLGRPGKTTPYAERVWEAMSRIPYGETLTYKELAAQAGGSARSVGGACRANHIPIIIPCHRVVAASGLGGYAGDWEKGEALSVKKWLLELEKSR